MSSHASAAKGLHVLLIDSDISNLLYMKRELQVNGYEVTLVDSAEAAIYMVTEQKCSFDIAISKIDLPQADGFKFLKQMRLNGLVPIVILMSNKIDGSIAKKALNEAASYVFLKPIEPNDLSSILHHLLDKRLNLSKPTNSSNPEPAEANTETEENDRETSVGQRVTNTQSRRPRRSRMVWTLKLQTKFEAALRELGELTAKPKQILQLMNEENLTSTQISSHLQNHKRHLMRIRAFQMRPQSCIFSNTSTPLRVEANMVPQNLHQTVEENLVPKHSVPMHFSQGSSFQSVQPFGVMETNSACNIGNGSVSSEGKGVLNSNYLDSSNSNLEDHELWNSLELEELMRENLDFDNWVKSL